MSQRIYDELVAAGAPALPETHFYRVRPMALKDYVDVQVRERRLWPLWSRTVGSMATQVDPYLRPTELAAVVWAAKHAHAEAFAESQPFARFIDDHPW